MNSLLLERLEPLVAEFEQQASPRSMAAEPGDFSTWLRFRLAPESLVPPILPAALPAATEHRQISSLLTLLHRHWRRFA